VCVCELVHVGVCVHLRVTVCILYLYVCVREREQEHTKNERGIEKENERKDEGKKACVCVRACVYMRVCFVSLRVCGFDVLVRHFNGSCQALQRLTDAAHVHAQV
jgi:hypothetical protein